MDIRLIRHTSVEIAKGLCYGRSDIPLSDTFEVEAQVIKDALRDFPDAKIFSSPLSRCAQLAQALGENVVFDTRLQELDFGEWEGRIWDELNKADVIRWCSSFVDHAPPGGESFAALAERVAQFLADLREQNIERAVIVTHGGPIRAAVALHSGLQLKSAFALQIGYGEIVALANVHIGKELQ